MELPTASSKATRPSLSYFDDDASTASVCSAVECAKLAPSNVPRLWSVINLFLFVWSFLLVLEISNEGDGAKHRLEGTRLYLIWKFGMTIIWCLEVTLTVLARADDENWQDSWPITMELLLAVYFTFDSIREFRKWKRVHGESVDGEILDAAISSIAYLYLLLKARPWDHFCRSRQRNTYDLIV